MKRRAFLALMGTTAALGLAGCSSGKFKTYFGPPVTQVTVNKAQRRMYLFNGTRVLKDYKIDLGFAPIGHKQFEGDGRTPEGDYIIDRRNPNSRYHLSVGISYPNADDIARATAMGKKPGGDIFIHGQDDPRRRRNTSDWTWGCIAVTNSEIEEVYAMVENGTPIRVNP